MPKDIDQQISSPPTAAALAAGIVVAMGFAIVFNTVWNQPDLASQSLREMMGGVVEIDARTGAADRARTSTHVIVAGKRERRDRPAAAGLLMQVQQGLQGLGYFTGPVDGVDGERTRVAVRQYQAKNGLAPTGRINRELLNRIRYSAKSVAASRVKLGSEGPPPDQRVILVQTGLAELGYRPGTIDGFVGDGTRRAIREFEMDRGLPRTGEISPRLLAELKKISGLSKLASP